MRISIKITIAVALSLLFGMSAERCFARNVAARGGYRGGGAEARDREGSYRESAERANEERSEERARSEERNSERMKAERETEYRNSQERSETVRKNVENQTKSGPTPFSPAWYDKHPDAWKGNHASATNYKYPGTPPSKSGTGSKPHPPTPPTPPNPPHPPTPPTPPTPPHPYPGPRPPYPWHPWPVVPWVSVAAWVGLEAAPIPYAYGNYGPTVVYESNSTSNTVVEQQQSSQQAAELATNGTAPNDDTQWMPLGVFAVSTGGSDHSHVMMQLSISKEGAIAGTYYDMLSDATQKISGRLDKKTQKVAWHLTSNPKTVFETGLENLTKESCPLLVHFGDKQTQKWKMTRVKSEDATAPEAPQDDAQ